MPAQIQITVRDMPHSTALETEIRRKLVHLEKINPKITAFHVTLEAPAHHHRNGAHFSVRLDVRMPGAEIVVTRDQEDIYIALRETCHAARRQLTEFMRRRQDPERKERSRRRDISLAGGGADE
jgi:ribosomal subunit interface protein